MLKGIYTSALGMKVLEKRQEVSANNLANVNTVGYKKDTVTAQAFPEMLVKRLEDPSLPDERPQVGPLTMGVQLNEIVTDHSKGVYSKSENPTKIALMGEGYFTVNTAQGERYTRNGEFNINPEGLLVTSDGYPVQGQKGQICIKEGDFSVDDQGRIFSGGKEVDRLKIVKFSLPLIKEGSSLFQGEEPEDVDTPQVAQGFREESNVSTIEEMVNMISLMRSYESNLKIIQTHDSTLNKAVNEIARL